LRVKLVVRLVVALLGILLANRLATRRAAGNQVIAGPEAERWNADLGEGEMVRAIEAAAFRMRVGGEVAAFLLARSDEVVEQVEPRSAGDGEVLRRAPHSH